MCNATKYLKTVTKCQKSVDFIRNLCDNIDKKKGAAALKKKGSLKMTILTTGSTFAICADEQELRNGIKKFYAFEAGYVFSPDNGFKVKSKNSGRTIGLGKKQIDEFERLLPEAEKEWENKRMQMTAEANKDTLSENLNNLLVSVLAQQSADAIFEATMPKVREKITQEFGLLPQIHEIRTPSETHTIKGITHEKFDTVLNLVYEDIPVFLTGAAGTGKNVICKQIAESLGIEFYFTNAVTQEYKLTGFIDANGLYHETQFYKAFKNGGLFFLDEMDGSIPEVLIMLNAAIANRYFDFPNEKVEAHKDFRIIAAGNTFGTGADMEYTGRYQLDAASLDRFALVEIDYSPKIEEAVSGGDKELCEFIRAFRTAVSKVGMKHLATYRSIERIHKLADSNMDLNDVLRISLLKNMTKDDINIVKGEMTVGTENRYFRAMVNA